jgi:hypothetical protein
MMLGDKLHTKNNENTNLNDIIPLNTHDPWPMTLGAVKNIDIYLIWS